MENPKLISKSKDVTLTLNYIDKMYSSLVHSWDSLNRTALWKSLICIILILLAIDIISIENSVDLSGFKMQIALGTILGGGAFTVLILSISYFLQDLHSTNLERELVRLYKDIGCSEPGIEDRSLSPFINPSVFELITLQTTKKGWTKRPLLVKSFDLTNSITLAFITLLLPLISQIFAGIRLNSELGWTIWLVFGVILAIQIWCSLAGIRRLIHDKDESSM